MGSLNGILGFLTDFWSVRGDRTHLAKRSKRDLGAVGDRCRNHRSIRTFGNAGPKKISRAASLAGAIRDPIGRCGPAFAGGRSCRGEVLGQIWSVLSVGKVIRSRQLQRATSFSLNGELFASGNSA